MFTNAFYIRILLYFTCVYVYTLTASDVNVWNCDVTLRSGNVVIRLITGSFQNEKNDCLVYDKLICYNIIAENTTCSKFILNFNLCENDFRKNEKKRNDSKQPFVIILSFVNINDFRIWPFTHKKKNVFQLTWYIDKRKYEKIEYNFLLFPFKKRVFVWKITKCLI